MACPVGGMSYLDNNRNMFQFETQGDPPAKVEVDLANAGNGVGADLVG